LRCLCANPKDLAAPHAVLLARVHARSLRCRLIVGPQMVLD
jgi:hypothetical protein